MKNIITLSIKKLTLYMLVTFNIILLTLFVSCSSNSHIRDLKAIYTKSVKYHGPERNPVILIPGILGSKLIDSTTRKEVWGTFGGNFANPKTSEGKKLISLPFDTAESDSVIPNGVLDDVKVKILGMNLHEKAYHQIISILGLGGYMDEDLASSLDYGKDHFTCFQFSYDWRKSSSVNAKKLHDFIVEKKKYVQMEYEKRFGIKGKEVKFDIVAHSMGGLVTRYFLRYGNQQIIKDKPDPKLNWSGAQYVDKAILIGTPNGGSLQSFYNIINGVDFPLFLPFYSPEIIGSFVSTYEMMPRTRFGYLKDEHGKNIDLFKLDNWKKNRWGLAKSNNASEINALKQRLEIAKRFTKLMDKPAIRPKELGLDIMIGDSEKTIQSAHFSPRKGFHDEEYALGDGTVLRTSALLDEREGRDWGPLLRSPIEWSNISFYFQDHLGLTKDPQFTDNLLFQLLEQ